jgi:excisionase family DNA binding protein
VTEGLTITLSPKALEEIVEEVAARVLAQLAERDDRDGAWPEWMSVETASRYLNITPERLRKLKQRGKLAYYQEGVGCRVFFRRADLDEAMDRWRVR